MKITFWFYSLINMIGLVACAQFNPNNIDIVRDKYGVPHIFSKTDAELAYGRAWAHAEDDLKTIQQGYLAGNSLLSDVEGKKAFGMAFIAQFIGSDRLYEQKSP